MDNNSYRLGATGTVLNPDALVPPFVDLTKISGFDTPEIRSTERDHEGTDGGFLDADFEKMRTLVFEGQMISNGINTWTFLDQLKYEWAPGRGVQPLYFQLPGLDERLIFVKALGVRFDIDSLIRLGSCDVQFTCQAENPAFYTSTLLTLALPQGATLVGGISFNLGFNMDFGAPVSPAYANAYNGGNRDATALITIQGPVDNPRIYNDTTGNVLDFGLSLSATDSLVVDLYNRTVTLNGTASRRNTLKNPDWFLLKPGNNIIRYRADSSGNPDASISYRYAWR